MIAAIDEGLDEVVEGAPPGLVTAALDALVLWLLYGSRGARAYFGS